MRSQILPPSEMKSLYGSINRRAVFSWAKLKVVTFFLLGPGKPASSAGAPAQGSGETQKGRGPDEGLDDPPPFQTDPSGPLQTNEQRGFHQPPPDRGVDIPWAHQSRPGRRPLPPRAPRPP